MKKKNLSVNTQDYIELKYIDEKTNELVYHNSSINEVVSK